MAGLRPARTVRNRGGQVWTRTARKRPRKSFVKGAPHSKIRQFHMGTDTYYELQADLVSEQDVNLRDNSLESSRQAANRYLEKQLFDDYYFTLLKYPHFIIREHAALGVAGSDRISKGMKLAFGKPKGRMAQVRKGDVIFRSRIMEKDLAVLKTAFKRAQLKMSGNYTIDLTDIKNDPENLAKKGKAAKAFKKKKIEEEKPAEVAEGEEAAEGEEKAEGKEDGEGKKEEGEKKTEEKKDEKAKK
ncbi:MAG: 50S ribosomal protein L16 [Candidatus Micrarchaeia archaeon]